MIGENEGTKVPLLLLCPVINFLEQSILYAGPAWIQERKPFHGI